MPEELTGALPAEGVIPPAVEPVVSPVQEPEGFDPTRYAGKSPEEIARMHFEAQRLIGRQGSEVGELRRQVEALQQAMLAAMPPATVERPRKEYDLFSAEGIDEFRRDLAQDMHSSLQLEQQEEWRQTQLGRTAAEGFFSKYPDLKASEEFVALSAMQVYRQVQAGLMMPAQAEEAIAIAAREMNNRYIARTRGLTPAGVYAEGGGPRAEGGMPSDEYSQAAAYLGISDPAAVKRAFELGKTGDGTRTR